MACDPGTRSAGIGQDIEDLGLVQTKPVQTRRWKLVSARLDLGGAQLSKRAD